MARAALHPEFASPVAGFTRRQFVVAASLSVLVHLSVFFWLASPQFEQARLAGGGASFGISGPDGTGTGEAKEEAAPRESTVEPQRDDPERVSKAQSPSANAALPTDTGRSPAETPAETREPTLPRSQAERTKRGENQKDAPQEARPTASPRTASQRSSDRASDRTRAEPAPSERSATSAGTSGRPQPAAGRASAGRSEAGTGTGSGSATSGAGDAATSNYTGIVTEHIRRNRRSNAVGAGEAILEIAIGRNGQVRDLDIYRSSGSTRFDRQALRMARLAAPYPEPPVGQGAVLVRIRGR